MTEQLHVFGVTVTYVVMASDAEEALKGLSFINDRHVPTAASVRNLSTGEEHEATYD